jgi:hypothetical protein
MARTQKNIWAVAVSASGFVLAVVLTRYRRGVRREKALERLRHSGWTLPPGWKFKREELYERGGRDRNP